MLIMLAFLLVALAHIYRSKTPRPLPRGRRWLQWLPKYWLPVALTSDPADLTAVTWELTDWLGPLGFELRIQDDAQLVFGRGSRVGDLTAAEARRVVIRVPLPLDNPARVEVHYESSAVFDTGDLARLCHDLLDKEEALPDDPSTPRVETGNPYQSPN